MRRTHFFASGVSGRSGPVRAAGRCGPDRPETPEAHLTSLMIILPSFLVQWPVIDPLHWCSYDLPNHRRPLRPVLAVVTNDLFPIGRPRSVYSLKMQWFHVVPDCHLPSFSLTPWLAGPRGRCFRHESSLGEPVRVHAQNVTQIGQASFLQLL